MSRYKQALENRHFRVPLNYNETLHQFTVPVYLGDHPTELAVTYDCVLDFVVPTIFVPKIDCHYCEGTKFDPRS